MSKEKELDWWERNYHLLYEKTIGLYDKIRKSYKLKTGKKIEYMLINGNKIHWDKHEVCWHGYDCSMEEDLFYGDVLFSNLSSEKNEKETEKIYNCLKTGNYEIFVIGENHIKNDFFDIPKLIKEVKLEKIAHDIWVAKNDIRIKKMLNLPYTINLSKKAKETKQEYDDYTKKFINNHIKEDKNNEIYKGFEILNINGMYQGCKLVSDSWNLKGDTTKFHNDIDSLKENIDSLFFSYE